MTAVLVASLLAVATGLLWRPEGSGRSALRATGGKPASMAGPSVQSPWGRWFTRRGDRRTADGVEADALDLLDGLAPALRAGLPPVAALRLMTSSGAGSVPAAIGGGATTGPRTARLVSGLGHAAGRGEPLAPVWSAYAEAVGSDDLRLVAAAWSMCDTLGSPLAPTVSLVSDVVRRRRAVRQRIAAALAGPRATMRVLTALPLSGPVLALAVGVSPGDLYAQPAGAVSLAAGVGLLALGRLWAARMIGAVTVERRRAP